MQNKYLSVTRKELDTFCQSLRLEMELEDEEFAISAKELEEEKKREKEEQAKKVRRTDNSQSGALEVRDSHIDTMMERICDPWKQQ